MESLMQLLLVLAFMYWMTPYLAPRRRPARPPERPRAIGRFASTPGPERREHGDADGEGNGVGDLDGKDEDRPRLQPSLKGTHYSPSLRVVSDQSRERQETPVRASTSRAALPSGHVSRASVSSTASRRTVRWATESDEEDVKPLVNAREALASSVTSAEPCEMIFVGSSTSSSKALQSSGTQTRSNLSTANAGSSSTRGAHSATRVASTSYVTPSASVSSSLRSDTSAPPAPAATSTSAVRVARTPLPSVSRSTRMTPIPSSSRTGRQTPVPSSSRTGRQTPISSSSHTSRMTPVPSSSRTGRMTPVPSSSRTGRMTPASSASRAGQVTTMEIASNDEYAGDRAPIPARSASVVSAASTMSTWSENRRILDIYDRQFVWFKNLANTMLDNGQPAGTGWFESESDSVIDSPPDFSACKDVRVGDVFCHRTPIICQLWMWVQPVDNILPDWEEVQVGYRRWDGRKLSITKGRKRPSWVL